MKKFFLFAMLFAVASMFTSCEDPDKKLVNDLKGTWSGTTTIDDDDLPVEYQFFESTDGHTGMFIEVTHLSILDTIDYTVYEVPYRAYVGGSYSVKDGWLSITYDSETSTIIFDEDVAYDYIAAFLDNARERGDEDWMNETPEDVTEYFINSRTEDIEDEWREMCDNFNKGKKDGFSHLTVSPSKMSFSASDGPAEFDRTDDIFDSYPFED